MVRTVAASLSRGRGGYRRLERDRPRSRRAQRCELPKDFCKYATAARFGVWVATYFGAVLEHRFVEQLLDDAFLEAFDLHLEFAEPTGFISLGGIVLRTPAVAGVVGDASLRHPSAIVRPLAKSWSASRNQRTIWTADHRLLRSPFWT